MVVVLLESMGRQRIPNRRERSYSAQNLPAKRKFGVPKGRTAAPAVADCRKRADDPAWARLKRPRATRFARLTRGVLADAPNVASLLLGATSV